MKEPIVFVNGVPEQPTNDTVTYRFAANMTVNGEQVGLIDESAQVARQRHSDKNRLATRLVQFVIYPSAIAYWLTLIVAFCRSHG